MSIDYDVVVDVTTRYLAAAFGVITAAVVQIMLSKSSRLASVLCHISWCLQKDCVYSACVVAILSRIIYGSLS